MLINGAIIREQGQLKSALKEVMTIMKQPFVAIKHAVKHILKNIKQVLLKFRKIMIRMKVLIKNICKLIFLEFFFLFYLFRLLNF